MSTVLFLCDDLMFTSKVTATARASGITALVTRNMASTLARVTATPVDCVLLDLHSVGNDLLPLLAGLRALPSGPPRVIAYGSHVNTELLNAAREAGCDQVLPRSKFTAQLEGSLASWCQPVTTPVSPESA